MLYFCSEGMNCCIISDALGILFCIILFSTVAFDVHGLILRSVWYFASFWFVTSLYLWFRMTAAMKSQLYLSEFVRGAIMKLHFGRSRVFSLLPEG